MRNTTSHLCFCALLLALAIPRCPMAQQPATAFGRGLIWGLDGSGQYRRFLSDSGGTVRERIENGAPAQTGILSPSPASAASDASTLVLAWRGRDNSLMYRFHRNGAWEGSRNGGGRLAGSPVPVFFAGALRIFCLGPDGVIRQWSPDGWSMLPPPAATPTLKFGEVPFAFIRNGSLILWGTGHDGLSTWESTSGDGTAFTPWKRIAPGPSLSFAAHINGKGPMTVNNHSGSSDAHALHILALADACLGVETMAESRPSKQMGMADSLDRFFVGRYYATWIDQTGFYGEMNALWVLNGRMGVELDFTVAPDGEPLSSFIPGETNDGRWGPGYDGAEHIEVPIQGQGQWGLDEAGFMFGAASRIEWWRACNGKGTKWTDHFAPIVDQPGIDNLSRKMVWEGAFVKVADYTTGNTGATCGQDYPMEDGRPHPAYLRVGAELYGDRPMWRRSFQYRNPAGNPNMRTGMNIVTGVAFGFAPSKRPEHRLFHYRSGTGGWRQVGENVRADEIHCGTISLSTTPGEIYGYTFRASGGNTCSCHCFQHGGIELGGDGGVGAVNIAGGSMSREGIETFEILGAPPEPHGRKYSFTTFESSSAFPAIGPFLARTERIGNRILFHAAPALSAQARLEIRDIAGVLIHSAAGGAQTAGPSGRVFGWDPSRERKGLYFYSLRVEGEGPAMAGQGKILID